MSAIGQFYGTTMAHFISTWSVSVVRRGCFRKKGEIYMSLLCLIEAGDCYFRDDSVSYTGKITVDRFGGTCVPWSHPVAVTYLATQTSNPVFPETNITDSANYCRNPTNWSEPWCLKAKNVGYDYCNIPWCPTGGRYHYQNMSECKRLSHYHNM